MALSYKAMMAGVTGFLVFGAVMAYVGYNSSIYPVELALGNLARAESAQTPETLAKYVVEARHQLRDISGNPVWSFPTPETDFDLIKLELDNILSRANSIASLEPHSSAYSTGMNDMHLSLESIQKNIVEALPYMYVSTNNIVLSSVWIAIILGLFAVMKRGRSRFKEKYETQ